MTLEERHERARVNIGRRCRWHDEPVGTVIGTGTIIGVTTIHGWPRYIVDWDDGAPPWWTDTPDPAAVHVDDDAEPRGEPW